MRRGVLFVSPRGDDATVLSRMLGLVSMPVEHAGSFRQARSIVLDEPFQAILTEANLPDGNWRDILALAKSQIPGAEVIVTDPVADPTFWAEVLNWGAYDLIAQPFATAEVQRILANACTRFDQSPRAARAAL